MQRELNYCINKISERKIFATEQNIEALNSMMRRVSVRNKKGTLINWLNQYSEQSEEAFIQKGKRDTHEAQMMPLIKLEERRKKIEEGMSCSDSSSDEEDEV